MKQIGGSTRVALEPTSIDKCPKGWQPDAEIPRYRWTPTGWWWGDDMRVPQYWHNGGQTYTPSDYHPDPFMRAQGYTRNPATCLHNKKRFHTRWVCSECGTAL